MTNILNEMNPRTINQPMPAYRTVLMAKPGQIGMIGNVHFLGPLAEAGNSESAMMPPPILFKKHLGLS